MFYGFVQLRWCYVHLKWWNCIEIFKFQKTYFLSSYAFLLHGIQTIVSTNWGHFTTRLIFFSHFFLHKLSLSFLMKGNPKTKRFGQIELVTCCFNFYSIRSIPLLLDYQSPKVSTAQKSKQEHVNISSVNSSITTITIWWA